MLKCSDGNIYVVKFQNNLQGTRTLANDLLGTLLAKQLGLPVAVAAVVEVSAQLIESSRGMNVQHEHFNEACKAGLCFGSRYFQPRIPASHRPTDASTGSPSMGYLKELGNLDDFIGMLVFDKWTCNTDPRQVLFMRDSPGNPDRVVMIDDGYCFHACKWNFPDHISVGVFGEWFVYNSIEGMDAFSPWLRILENEINGDVIGNLARQIPPEWYSFDNRALEILVRQLNRRRRIVRELLRTCCSTIHHSFRRWRTQNSTRLGVLAYPKATSKSA